MLTSYYRTSTINDYSRDSISRHQSLYAKEIQWTQMKLGNFLLKIVKKD